MIALVNSFFFAETSGVFSKFLKSIWEIRIIVVAMINAIARLLLMVSSNYLPSWCNTLRTKTVPYPGLIIFILHWT